MAESIDLRDLPDDIGASYLTYETTLPQCQQGRKFIKGNYIEGLKIYRTLTGKIPLKADVYHSQSRNGEPHKTTLSIDRNQKTVTEAFCGCKGG